MRIATLAVASIVCAATASAQVQTTLVPVLDTSIYEESGSLGNGQGAYLFAGMTAQGHSRRALLAFDLSTVPDGATVVSAELRLHVSKTVAGAEPVSLHRVLAEWGEGTSNADANEGTGTAATSGDATWTHRLFDASPWATPGGDIEATASASRDVSGVGFYTWSSAGMTADVQAWVDGTVPNHGWMVVGSETASRTAKRFDSRENPVSDFRPSLSVTYVTTATGREAGAPLPSTSLAQNFPNPFTDRTEIAFRLDRAADVSLEVFDLLGRRVASLVRATMQPGEHTVPFLPGSGPVGLYLVRLQVDGQSHTRQMVRVE